MLLHALIAALSLSAAPPVPPTPPVPPVPPAPSVAHDRDDDDDVSDDVEQAMEDAREEVEQAREQTREALQQVRELQRHHAHLVRMTHPKMGVATSPATDGVVGARIESVATGSPAEQAGLKIGDIITAVNGNPLDTRNDGGSKAHVVARLLELVHQAKPGDKLAVDYVRGSEHKKATVVLPKVDENMSFSFEMPGNWGNMISEAMAGFPLPGRWMDMELVNVDPDLGEYFGTKEGLLVVRVPKDANLPLKSGDVILKIGDRQPKTPVQAVKIFRSYDAGDTLTLEVMRHKERKTITVQVPGGGHTAGRGH